MRRATVAICTRNRARTVGRAVEAALAQAAARDADVLAVDNASTDDTPAVLAALAARAAGRLRVVREAEVGLSAARNRALAAADAQVVVFLDDDAVPRPGWLAALLAPYAEPAVACVGGRVVLAFERPAPAWVVPALHPALSAYDQGPAPRTVRYGEADYPYGANTSFRTADARAAGGFSTRMGLRGARQLQHEEIDLCYRLERAGREIRYAPDAVVDHWIPPERVRPEWFVARHRQGGESAALFILRSRGVLRALWRLRWKYGRALFLRSERVQEGMDAAALVRECARQEARGYARGLARELFRLEALRRRRAAAPPVLRPAGGAS
ncbi:MAG TPA: glycosyltransferase [Candidatus Binatia bacterium]|nr:glycosyltransferase [Candidatus Binatia bacterium]